MLASSSNENYVMIWKPDSNQPFIKFENLQSTVETIKWSNGSSSGLTGAVADEPQDKEELDYVLLAAGC